MTSPENNPTPPDSIAYYLNKIAKGFGVEPEAPPAYEESSAPTTTPRPRASDIRKHLTPDPASEADIAWVQELMRDEPLVSMTTPGAEATIPMYSIFTTEPDGKLRFLFRSFESTEHATLIDEATASHAGRLTIQLLLMRSNDLGHVGLELFGQASRVAEADVERYMRIYLRRRRERGHTPGEHQGHPNYPLYVIEDWSKLQVQSRLRNEEGEHISNGKARVTEEQLRGFDAPQDGATEETT